MIGVDQGTRVRAGFVFTLCGAALVLVVQTVIGGPAAGADPEECVQQSHGVSAHFLTHYANFNTTIAGVALAGFDSDTCDGEPVVVTLSGNEAGDPTAMPTKLLTVLDSSLDPCSGSTVSPPVVIAHGKVVLHGCPTEHSASGAAYADIHDLTRISVKVAGHDIPIAGAPNFEPPTIDEPSDPDPGDPEPEGSTDTNTGQDADDSDAEVLGVQQLAGPSSGDIVANAVGGAMPDTGGPKKGLLWVGVLLVLFGFTSLLWDLGKPRGKGAAD